MFELRQVPTEAPGDTRSELMKAIQQAGGTGKAGLKKIKKVSLYFNILLHLIIKKHSIFVGTVL